MSKSPIRNNEPDCQHPDDCRRSERSHRFCDECWRTRQRKRRKKISERTLRAATIIAWLELPHELAKEMSEDEIIGLVEYDHYPIRKADGGEDNHWNIRPLLRHDHLEKTKRDAADMAHERKVRRAEEKHARRMTFKHLSAHDQAVDTSDIPEAGEEWFKKAKVRWPSRPFPRKKKRL